MKKIFLVGLAILMSIGLHAQILTPATSAPQKGISQDRINRIDQMLNEAIDANQVPGLVAMIVKDGKVVYHSAKGFADLPSQQKMEKDQIFRIASQTKAITSTAVMMLWEEGKFQLSDPISKYIPEFKNPQVMIGFRFADSTYSTRPASREITIKDLLTHTSGIGYGMIDGDERMKII
ncbi:MAG: CubicO group peptidase (beta-lactamase class C family), partial [Algoriphagus sp.]